MKREFRNFKAKIEVRKKDEGSECGGYAAVFNSLSEDLGGFRERIMPGAFARALREGQDVRALVNHDPSMILGRSTAGTLSLKEDENGLEWNCSMPNTSYASDLRESLNRGDIDQCSFGFVARTTKWSEEPDPDDPKRTMVVRELHDVDLFDVSAVTYPAYPQTNCDMRTLFPDGEPDDVVKKIEPPAPVVDEDEKESARAMTRVAAAR